MERKLPANHSLKQQLRRVMSDRALKIVKQSETKKENINNSIIQSSSQFNDSTLSLQTRLASKLSQKTVVAKNLTNKIILQPIKTFEINDKESLINHIKRVYDETVKTNGSIIFAIQSIINSILHYINSSAEKNTNVNEILRENLFQTNRQLSMKYRNDEQNESLRMEAQMQIMLQIENFIQLSNKQQQQQQIDDDLDDFVWEIANSIRWLNQTFKEKFRIEKFLFGEIYSNYYLNASDLVLNLMEELGYDKEDNNDTEQLNNSNNNNNTSTNGGNDDNSINNNSKTNDDSVLSSNNNQSVNNESSDSIDNNNDDILNDSKRKKLVSRFPNASFSMSRSIMVQRKRLHLKIRSPYKSPSKAHSVKWLQNNDNLRRSPRIKEKQSLKRTSRCTITDTPIHKQNSTRLTKRQQKIIKRISFQQFKTTTTVIPDTPVKNECRIIIKGTPSPKKSNGFSFQAKFLNK